MAFLSIPVTFSSQNPFFSPKFFEEKRINWHKLNFKSVKATYCLPTIEIYIVGYTHTHTHRAKERDRDRDREREREHGQTPAIRTNPGPSFQL